MKDPYVDHHGSAGPTSLSLLERVKSGVDGAWEKLIDLYGPMVFGWGLRAGLQRADAADVAQDVFAAVARSIAGFRRDRPGDSLRGWLFAIARNKIRDRHATETVTGVGGSDLQHHLATVAAHDADDADDSENAARLEETQAVYRRVIALVRASFEPRTWEAFWKVTVEDQCPADVAAALGVSRNAVYVATARVRQRLRAEFAALADLEEPL